MNITNVSPEFATDLIKLINSCKGITYNAKVSFGNTKFDYVTLDKIYAHIKKDNNFALLEPLGTNAEGKPALQIILIHKSGEAITSDYYALRVPENAKKQDEGSAITYTKRYALGSFLGISTDIDNDANSGNGGMEMTDWRQEYIRICNEKGIDSIVYAQTHGINKKTTQDEYKDIVSDLRDYVPQGENTVSMNDI